MEQMKIAEDKIVPLDFDSEELPFQIRELRPVVFREETSYWCLLGPDPHQGIFGNGETVLDALADWLETLKERLKTGDENDQIANYARERLQASNRNAR
jgi:hypothetical protein